MASGAKKCWKKHDGSASKDVYKLVTGDESWICAYELETNQQSTVLVFELEPNQMKVICGKVTSNPLYRSGLAPNDFFLFPHNKKKCVFNYFRRQKMLLKRSKPMFWRSLNRKKTNTNHGRNSKHSEYSYAKKCQTFLWKCQISNSNTRNMLGQKCM